MYIMIVDRVAEYILEMKRLIKMGILGKYIYNEN